MINSQQLVIILILSNLLGATLIGVIQNEQDRMEILKNMTSEHTSNFDRLNEQKDFTGHTEDDYVTDRTVGNMFQMGRIVWGIISNAVKNLFALTYYDEAETTLEKTLVIMIQTFQLIMYAIICMWIYDKFINKKQD